MEYGNTKGSESLSMNINNNSGRMDSTPDQYGRSHTGFDCHIEHKSGQKLTQTCVENDLCIGDVNGLNIDENKQENCDLDRENIEVIAKEICDNVHVYDDQKYEGNLKSNQKDYAQDKGQPEPDFVCENNQYSGLLRSEGSTGDIETDDNEKLNMENSKEITMFSQSDVQASVPSDRAIMPEPASCSFKHCLQKDSDSDRIVVKTRKLDGGVEGASASLSANPINPEQIRKKSSSDKSLTRCNRHSSSGSDRESSSRPRSDEMPGSEDEDIFDEYTDLSSETSEPCECDECLLDAEPDKPKPEPQLRKFSIRQSSWGKIRNIIHWSPFIQHFRKRKYPWIQLAGHQGNFQAGDPGAILKKYDKKEHRSFNKLMKDKLRPYVPEYLGEAAKDGDCYLQLQDLLCEFEAPCVMDIKMGCRTYLEDELSKAREKPTLRKDMYQKMVEVDPNAPTQEEHDQKAITKPRYMQWRDDMSSSVNLGFRIEGIRKSDGAQVKNFKTTKDKNSVKECLKLFLEENPAIINKYLRRLKAVRATQEDSAFFKSHEIIGSSLLFVHDKAGQASIWMIDFGKTVPLPESVTVNHRNEWVEGNHEDGYLNGVDSLIEIFDELHCEFCENSRVNNSELIEKSSSKDSENCTGFVQETNTDSRGLDESSSSSNKNTTFKQTSETNNEDCLRDSDSVKILDTHTNESVV